MFDLYKNIQQLCEERSVSVSKMLLDIGMSKSTLSNLRNGRTESIKTKTAHKIAQYLCVDVDTVLHGTKEPTVNDDGLQTLLDDERVLLNSYRTMTESDKQLMLSFVRRIKGQDNVD